MVVHPEMDYMDRHWQTTARIDEVDTDKFCIQCNAMTQLTGELMLAHLIAIDPLWGNLMTKIAGLPDKAFTKPQLTSEKRDALLNKIDAVFN
jgi:hypothetical protein